MLVVFRLLGSPDTRSECVLMPREWGNKNNCVCLICGIGFHRKAYSIKVGENKYCGRNCYAKARSEWMKDKSFNPVYKIDFKGKNNPNYKGVKPITCIDCGKELNGRNKRLRCARCNYDYYTGPNHHMWMPNKTRLYPVSWTSTYKWQIRHRDEYKCQVCGVPQSECKTHLPVHHIDYDKSNIKPDNLVTLCNSCHAKTNFRREYWKQYFLRGGEANANSSKSQA